MSGETANAMNGSLPGNVAVAGSAAAPASSDSAGRPPATSDGPVALDAIGSPREITGTADLRLARRLMEQVGDCVPVPDSLPPLERRRRMEAAAATLKGIGPRDDTEGMLAAQMVATHNLALDCLARANGIRDPDWRAMEMRYGARLLQLWTRQLEALDRQRGKGTRKLRIEHVRLEPEGREILRQVHERKS